MRRDQASSSGEDNAAPARQQDAGRAAGEQSTQVPRRVLDAVIEDRYHIKRLRIAPRHVRLVCELIVYDPD